MFRLGVSALIINNKQQLLVVNLNSFEDRYFAVPGGGVDQGETLEEAVYRELDEELNIKRQDLQPVGQSDTPVRFTFKEIELNYNSQSYTGSERYFFGFRFLGADKEIRPKDGEVRRYKWAPLDQLQNYLLFDNQLEETIEKIRELFPESK